MDPLQRRRVGGASRYSRGKHAELPLFFWTELLTPEAATTAGGLKMAGRAVIIGHDVFSSVAEASFTGVSNTGLMWRSSSLSTGGELRPTLSGPIDKRVITKRPWMCWIHSAAPPRQMDAERTEFSPYRRDAGEPAPTLDKATMHAALMVLYGTLDWFIPTSIWSVGGWTLPLLMLGRRWETSAPVTARA